ncbi:MAG: hypothetical protein Q8R36_00415 [bacterium]|nr:hypothetical protein [bacterium]
MDFFKKLFGFKKDNVMTSSDEKCFMCENCGQKRPLSQKKEHIANEAGVSKKVCEFC